LNEEQQAENASRILNDPMVVEAFELLRKEFLIGWENSSTHDAETRETLWLGLKILSRLQSHFESIISTGQLAKAQRDSNILF